MKSLLWITGRGAAGLVLLLLIGAALAGSPVAFRLVCFVGFASAVLLIANVGPILAAFGPAQQRAARARARLDGCGLRLPDPREESGRTTTTNLIRLLAAVNACTGLIFILSGIPAVPAGALLGLLAFLPTALMSLFVYQAKLTADFLGRVADRAEQAEQVHASVRALAARLTAQIAAEAESGMALVASVVVYAARAVAQEPRAAALEITFSGITDNPDDAHFGLQNWINDVIAILDLQPIERAQAWIDQISAADADFVRAATGGGDLHFALTVDPA